jgi:hypothetical protein
MAKKEEESTQTEGDRIFLQRRIELFQKSVGVESLLKKFEDARSKKQELNSFCAYVDSRIFCGFRNFSGVYNNLVSTNGINVSLNPKNFGSSRLFEAVKNVADKIAANTADKSIDWLALDHSNIKHLFGDGITYPDKWAENARKFVLRYLNAPESNFYNMIYDAIMDMEACGNAVVGAPLFQAGNSRYYNIPISDAFLSINSDGSVYCSFRLIKLTAREAFTYFGANLPQQVLDKLNSVDDRQEEKSEYLQACMEIPPLMLEGSKIPNKYLFVTIYVPERKIIEMVESATRRFIFARYFIGPGKNYGDSILNSCVPLIEQINAFSSRITETIEYAADPVILRAKGSGIDRKDIYPGAVIDAIEPLTGQYNPLLQEFVGANGHSELLDPYLDKLVKIFRDAIGAIDLQINAEAMNPTQVSTIEISQFQTIRTFISRIEDEIIAPIVKDALRFGSISGEIEPFDYESAGIPKEVISKLPADPLDVLKIRFKGRAARLASLQERIENENFMQSTMAFAAQINPQAVQLSVDARELMTYSADLRDLYPPYLVDDKQYQQNQLQLQKQQQQQAMAEQIKAVGEAQRIANQR